jgi:serine/threonine protein kinase
LETDRFTADGGSGTLAYTPPEAFAPSPTTGALPSPDRASDMWALGLILYLLCFFSLPFSEAKEDGDTVKLEEEVRAYKGCIGRLSCLFVGHADMVEFRDV